MSEYFVPYAQRADRWIEENRKRITRRAPIAIFDAENILISELGYGLLKREDVQSIFFDENEENLAGLRMLFKCMSENRRFTSLEIADPESDGINFRITEVEGNLLRTYNVPAITGMNDIINGYVSSPVFQTIQKYNFVLKFPAVNLQEI